MVASSTRTGPAVTASWRSRRVCQRITRLDPARIHSGPDLQPPGVRLRPGQQVLRRPPDTRPPRQCRIHHCSCDCLLTRVWRHARLQHIKSLTLPLQLPCEGAIGRSQPDLFHSIPADQLAVWGSLAYTLHFYRQLVQGGGGQLSLSTCRRRPFGRRFFVRRRRALHGRAVPGSRPGLLRSQR